MRSIVLILIAVATNTIPRWIRGIDGDVFCVWQAVSFVFMGLAAQIKGNTKQERIMFDWCVLFAINNAIDEMYRVALKTNVFEVSFAIAITAWTVIRLIRCRTNKSN